jgi:hypothetical protein
MRAAVAQGEPGKRQRQRHQRQRAHMRAFAPFDQHVQALRHAQQRVLAKRA